MMPRSISIILIAIACSVWACQSPKVQDAQAAEPLTQSTDSPAGVKDGWLGFLPTGHVVQDTLAADLNNDGHTDMLLLVAKEDEAQRLEAGEEEVPRQLFILVHDPHEGWMLGGHSYYAVLQANMSGAFGADPYQGLSTNHQGSFSIEHYGGSSWRWSHTTTFTYSAPDHAWILASERNESYHTGNPEATTVSLKTAKDFGKILFDDYKGPDL